MPTVRRRSSIAPVEGTNHPLPSSGVRLTWSPDSPQLAFISATPGPEADANGDPMVITRYLYKPTASEGGTRANDNRRLHIFVADVASKAGPPAHRRRLLRALDRLVAEGRRDPVRLESRAGSRSLLQLRRLRGQRRVRPRPPAHRHEERRVLPDAGRRMAASSRSAARSVRSRPPRRRWRTRMCG